MGHRVCDRVRRPFTSSGHRWPTLQRWPKVTAWVTPATLRALREQAAAHHLTVSQVAAEILERGIREQAETAGLGLLDPTVQGVVKREVGRMSGRLAHLIARTALESAASRRLVFQLLVRHLTPDEARKLNQATWTSSIVQ